MLDTTRMQWASLQQAISNAGPGALRNLGYEFLPIDNNPRHGYLLRSEKNIAPTAGYLTGTELRHAAVEVIERCGLWWVLPTRPFRFV